MKPKLILDIDPGIDDSLALLYVGLSDHFDLLGVTISSGNVDSQQGYANAKHVLSLLAMNHIPVFIGPGTSLYQPYTDARDTHGQDGLGEQIFASFLPSPEKSASQYILDQLERFPKQITIMALGPLTNLACLLEERPEGLLLAKEIRIMGGVHTVKGNCSDVAEYNFWCDPVAAAIFFESKLPRVYVYTLDVTYDILLTPNMREMIHQLQGPIAAFIYQITGFYVDFHWKQERTLGCIINDPLVPVDMIHQVVEFEPASIQMIIEGEKRGQGVTTWTEDGHILVSKKVDGRAFFKYFFASLFKDQQADIDLIWTKKMI
ncbi:nucleoside hydrolase [Vaginisenegalia massiliensis]|uniref:nucleoside hydrolase n=1 Tax=Vaginisenegalia massiliensis TaxID=2058294 RepID=UPI000F52643A|nr:nucleoside hydrolase [Vaginisenegalia massiliensis]